MFQAKSIMKTNLLTVRKDTDIYEAIQIMVENNITGLPVINDDMTVAGIISEKDVLKLLYNLEDKSGTVSEFMTKDAVTFDTEENLIEIAECLINHHFRRVPITSGGKLIGIISRKDIIGYILKLRHKGTITA